MTKQSILEKLLAGGYLLPRKTFKRKSEYCLYDAFSNPVGYVKPKTFKIIRDLLKKKNGELMLTLDLREVRKLHGNTLLKKQYKKSKK